VSSKKASIKPGSAKKPVAAKSREPEKLARGKDSREAATTGKSGGTGVKEGFGVKLFRAILGAPARETAKAPPPPAAKKLGKAAAPAAKISSAKIPAAKAPVSKETKPVGKAANPAAKQPIKPPLKAVPGKAATAATPFRGPP